MKQLVEAALGATAQQLTAAMSLAAVIPTFPAALAGVPIHDDQDNLCALTRITLAVRRTDRDANR